MKKSETNSNKTDKPSPGKKSNSVYFFVFSIILGLSFFWSIYDESITRRPWKEYQEKFFGLENEKLKSELEEAEKALD